MRCVRKITRKDRGAHRPGLIILKFLGVPISILCQVSKCLEAARTPAWRRATTKLLMREVQKLLDLMDAAQIGYAERPGFSSKADTVFKRDIWLAFWDPFSDGQKYYWSPSKHTEPLGIICAALIYKLGPSRVCAELTIRWKTIAQEL